jgi:hypothetical protein
MYDEEEKDLMIGVKVINDFGQYWDFFMMLLEIRGNRNLEY